MDLLARRLRTIVVTGCWWFLSAGLAATAAEPLEWKYAAGDVFNYQMVQDMQMSMDLGPGGGTSTGVKQTMDMTWKVESVDASGNAVIVQNVSRVQMVITAPGQAEVNYDTESEQPPQGYAAMVAPALKALTSSPFQVTMTSRGQIIDVQVPESLIAALSQGPGAAMLGSLASEEGFKTMASQNALTLPEADQLVEDHQWTATAEMDNPATGKIITKTTYRYAGPREVEGQQFEVFVPTIEVNFSSAEEEAGPKIEVVKQKSDGEILFNRSAGGLESTKIEQEMDSVITAGEQQINQHLQQTVTFQLIPPKAEP